MFPGVTNADVELTTAKRSQRLAFVSKNFHGTAIGDLSQRKAVNRISRKE